MKGLRPIRTVRDLMKYLEHCPPDAELTLMPEDGDGFKIGGVLEFLNPGLTSNSVAKPEVWILFDEFAEVEPSSERDDWGGGIEDEDEISAGVVVLPPSTEVEDVVRVRGKMRSA